MINSTIVLPLLPDLQLGLWIHFLPLCEGHIDLSAVVVVGFVPPTRPGSVGGALAAAILHGGGGSGLLATPLGWGRR